MLYKTVKILVIFQILIDIFCYTSMMYTTAATTTTKTGTKRDDQDENNEQNNASKKPQQSILVQFNFTSPPYRLLVFGMDFLLLFTINVFYMYKKNICFISCVFCVRLCVCLCVVHRFYYKDFTQFVKDNVTCWINLFNRVHIKPSKLIAIDG